MASLLLELFICLCLGALAGWQLPWLPARLAQPLMRCGVPISLATLLLRAPLTFDLLRVGLLGLLAPLGCLVLLRCTPLRTKIPDRVLRLGAAVGNTGYWGLPVAIALLPAQAVASAAVVDVAGTLITWSVGPLVLLGVPSNLKTLWSVALASPALQGLALAVMIGQTPWRILVAEVLWWPARGVFLLALVLVGMRLGLTLREGGLALGSGLPWAMGFKLLMVPAIVWLVGLLLVLPPLDQQVLVLQGAAPTAVSVLLLAEANQESVAEASTLVLCSTVLALVTVPLWWSLIR